MGNNSIDNYHSLIKDTEDISILLQRIRLNKVSRDQVIGELYHDSALRSSIRSMMKSKGATEEDVQEVFNICIIKFVKTVIKNSDINISHTVQSYITGIARFEWYGILRDRKKHTHQELDAWRKTENTTPESLLIDGDQKTLILDLLNAVGDKCKEVLLLWANGYKMKEIAVSVNYKSEGMAKKKKHQCFKNLLNYIEKNPDIKNLIR